MDNFINFIINNLSNIIVLIGLLIFMFFVVRYQISKNVNQTLTLMEKQIRAQQGLTELSEDEVEQLKIKIQELNNNIHDLQKLIENQDVKIESLHRRIFDLEAVNMLKSNEILDKETRIKELIELLDEIKKNCPIECEYSNIMLNKINKMIRGIKL